MSFLNNSKHTIKISQFLVITLAVHLLALASFAQTSSSSTATQAVGGTSTAQVTPAKTEKSPFGLSLGLEYSQSVAEDELGSRESGTDLSIAPSYKINDILTSSVRAVVSKSNNGAGDTLVSDTQIGLSIKGIKLNESVQTLHSIAVVAPTSETSRERDRLQTSLSVTNGLRYTQGIVKVDYRLGLSKNAHEFNINANGSPNIEYRIANSAELQINITDKFYIIGLGIYRWGRTYGGKERTSFEAHGDLNYDVSDKMTLNLGTSNVGSALKANGVDSNISAYDEDTSVVRAGVSLTL